MEDKIGVYVRLNGSIKYFLHDKDNPIKVKMPAKSTVKDLIANISLPGDRVGYIIINRELVGIDKEIRDGDEVSIYPIIMGG